MKIDTFKFFTSLICFSIACLNVQAAEQDNWYLAKEWQVDNRVNGMFWDYNETTQSGLLFCATENGVRAYDLDGTLVHSFGSGRYYDVVVDADGGVYATHYNGVTAFTKGPGRVTFVSVEHPGSRYYRYSSGEHFRYYPGDHGESGQSFDVVYLDFNGTGGGAKAYVLMEKNESLSGDYNWYPQNVVIEDGGSGYTGEVNASIRTFSGFSYKQIQFHSDAPVYDPSVDYAEGDVVRGHYSTSYSAYNFLYEFTANDISRINNDWNESSSYVEGDIVRILDGGSAAWYRRTNVVDEIDPDYNENPSVSSTQWDGIGLDNIDSLAQTGYFDLIDVTQSQGYDHAQFTVTVGNGYSQSWNLDGMNSVDGEAGRDISLQPQTGKLLVTDRYNVRFLDRNGTLLDEQFGSSGDAPGQFSGYVQDIDILPDSRIIVSDQQRINWFDENGSFLKRQEIYYPREMAVSPSGNILASRGYWNDYFELKNHDGDNIASIHRDTVFSNFNWDTPILPLTFIGRDAFAAYSGGAIVVFNTAYRTKGLPVPNKISEPAIRSITQRPGTNIIDVVFEILDSDDENATVGILAAVDGNFNSPQSWIAPTTLVDGSDARMGVPIATNMEHNISWDIGQDWAEPTGNLKFKIICQDARRSSPVDIHFLELPLEDGNLTISRSPILDDDIRSYYRFLLGTRGSNVSLDGYGNVVDNYGSVLLTPSGESTQQGREMFIDSTGHRWASYSERASAREGSTAGTVESREAINQIFPRNLPRQVNEYGFDVGYYGSNAWWVVSNSTFPYISFTRNDYEHNGSSNYRLGLKVAASYPYFAASGAEDWQRQVYLHIEDDALDAQLPDPILVEPSDKDESSSEGFGSSFAITGDWMVVGARYADFSRLYEDEHGNSWDEWYHDAGSVYLFDLSSGEPVEMGRFDCNRSNSYLGNSIDAFGEFVIVGAREQHQGESNWGQGGAYLLKIEADGNLTELAHLIADDGQQYDHFGDQVAITQNLIAISAPWARTTTPNGEARDDGGKVYVFSYDDAGNVELIHTLQDEFNEGYNHFGRSIDLDGNSLAVRTNNDWQSKVNLYKLNDQTLEMELTREIARPDEFDVQYFGQDISFDGGNLAISSMRNWSSERGIVFFYSPSSSGDYKLVHVFEPADDSERNAGFGQSISLSGDNLAVGLPNFDRTVDNQTRHDSGKVIVFTRQQN